MDLNYFVDEEKITRCAKCLYPHTKPDLFFNEQGICSACIAYEMRKKTDWLSRQSDLEAILESGKNDSGFDCIVPSSGGKDSTWQVLRLLELGAKPLVVTATTCHLTAIGRRNIDNLARFATTIEVAPNKEIRRKLNRLGLELVGDISWPEHVAIFTTPFQIAANFGIPLIFYGECPQNQYGGPPGTTEAKEMTRRWVSEFGGFNGLRPSDMVGKNGIEKADMRDYAAPSVDKLKDVRAYFLGHFYEWDSRKNASMAEAAGLVKSLPCKSSVWDFENLDNAQTGFHDWFCYLKYGYGRACAQLSVDIRTGLVSREEGLAAVEEKDGHCPDIYMGVGKEEMLLAIGIKHPRQLADIVYRFANKDLFTECRFAAA